MYGDEEEGMRLSAFVVAGFRRKYGHAKGLFDHILGNRRHLAKGSISEKGGSPSINSEIVM